MKGWDVLFDIISVFMIAVFAWVTIQVSHTNDRQFEELHMAYAVDYATEAAFRISVSTNTVGTDYENEGLNEVIVSPENILAAFEKIMCFNFGIVDSAENCEMIERGIAGGALLSHDGYYILEPYEYDYSPDDPFVGGEYRLLWGIKRPYLVYAPDGLYACSLVNNKWTRYSGELNEIGLHELQTGLDFTDTALTETLVHSEIASQVTEDLNRSILLRNVLVAHNNVAPYYLPGEDTVSQVNNLKSSSLLILYQDDAFLSGYKNMSVVSVGGVRVRPKTQVLGFTRPGSDVLYYCYAGQHIGEHAITPKRLFNTVQDAAAAGYHPDFVLLTKPIPE